MINGHGGWGGTQALRNRITVQGGFANAYSSVRNGLLRNLLENGRRPRKAEYMVWPYGGSGFGTDVNGIASLPGNPGEADPDFYPFTSVDGHVTFDVQKIGDHEFSLFEGRGVAQYGLYPDVIADMLAHSDGTQEEVDEAIGHVYFRRGLFAYVGASCRWARHPASIRS